ncbi:MAG: hypothetical protein ABSH46_21915 [Bryobacteraceae bacterium]
MRRLFLLPRYQRDAAKLLDEKEQDEMERHIADDLERHPRIPGGGGMRKARWAWQERWRAGDLLLRGSGRGLLHRRLRQEQEGESQ